MTNNLSPIVPQYYVPENYINYGERECNISLSEGRIEINSGIKGVEKERYVCLFREER